MGRHCCKQCCWNSGEELEGKRGEEEEYWRMMLVIELAMQGKEQVKRFIYDGECRGWSLYLVLIFIG